MGLYLSRVFCVDSSHSWKFADDWRRWTKIVWGPRGASWGEKKRRGWPAGRKIVEKTRILEPGQPLRGVPKTAAVKVRFDSVNYHEKPILSIKTEMSDV